MSPGLESHSIDNASKNEPITSSPDSVEVSLKQVQEVCTGRMLSSGGIKRRCVLYVSARLCLHISACLCKSWELDVC